MTNSTTNLVLKLLQKNSILLNEKEFIFQIKNHSSYPSIDAITSVLDHFNIENIAAEVPTNKEILKQLPNYFIAELKNSSDVKEFVLVEKEKTNCVLYSSENTKNTLSENDFLTKFTGVIIAIEELEKSELSSQKNTSTFLFSTILVALLFFILYTSTSSFQLIAILIAIVLTILFMWFYIKPIKIENKKLKKEQVVNSKFKQNFTVFKMLLNETPIIKTYIKGNNDIILGNLNAKIEITVIITPLSEQCRSISKQLKKILNSYGENIKIRVRFNTNNQNPKVFKTCVSLLNIFKEQGEKVYLQALHDLFDIPTPLEKWLLKWENLTNQTERESQLKKQNLWCQENLLNFTPEFLIGGQLYPKEYHFEDLFLFIEELNEENQNTSSHLTYFDDKIIFN
ncbi:cysteine peptidase family C39 domain-containing protein [Tenacibaculum sp. 190524A02b]|uniref:cysteine peptidase family C39 domain-containing protein n=1 Tax=Tenacibaculum vairaonense TaxID=3137860 RepID=UPI0032B123B0